MVLLFDQFRRKHVFIILALLTSFTSYSSSRLSVENKEYEVQRDSVWIKTSAGILFGIVFNPLESVKNGIVSLVCDKSGAGLSKTKNHWSEQSFEDKIKEYNELFTWLSNRKIVNSNMVGLHGMSEGGRLALNLAMEFPDKIAFVNTVSRPIESFKKNQLYAIRHYLLSRTNDTTNVGKAVSIWDAYLNDIGLGKISAETVQRINEFKKLGTNIDYLPNNSSKLPPRPLSQDIHFTQENKLDRINCPVLFQYGDLDNLVNSKKSLSLIPKHPKFTVKIYAKTDHSMNLPNGDIHPNFLMDKKE